MTLYDPLSLLINYSASSILMLLAAVDQLEIIQSLMYKNTSDEV